MDLPLKNRDGPRGLLLRAPEGEEGCTEGSVGRVKAVVRAISFSACSADVGLRLALANCSSNPPGLLHQGVVVLHKTYFLQHSSKPLPWKNGQKQ